MLMFHLPPNQEPSIHKQAHSPVAAPVLMAHFEAAADLLEVWSLAG